MHGKITHLLTFIYGAEKGAEIQPKLEALLENYRVRLPHPPPAAPPFDHSDTILITYGDMVQNSGEKPLQTLRSFLKEWVGGVVKGVHLLPFYPYSSDDGFSVIDYQKVNPDLGDWHDVKAFKPHFRLMFDAVINHISRQSSWFKGFLNNESPYKDYFIRVDPQTDLSAVFRPRALPLLTPVETTSGKVHVWTTFSADQIDLNYQSSELLLDILDTLLFYVAHGAEAIRLDAIGFMWKEIGTSSIHLPQTHALIQLMRAVLDKIAPNVALITETNVPHQDNISYFGDGRNEAQMVYNFSLPPLTLHAFHTGDATTLSKWAASLDLPSDRVTFFNFLASHDGVGLTPARGILNDEEIQRIADRVERLNGFVSYKTNTDGSESAYELNINFLDALGKPGNEEAESLIVNRFITSQAIMLALRGVPGIYFHSLFGSRSWREGVAQTGQKRTINREKLRLDDLNQELKSGFRRAVFSRYLNLLRVRTSEKAFSPYGKQEVVQLNPAVFAVLRQTDGEQILCAHNVSDRPVVVEFPFPGTELLHDKPIKEKTMQLGAYETIWLKKNG
ncbi:MAG: alpha-amylase family glycosyl hydrolase [Ardenticatenaceae bacterium]|nr:alpha-amylase family glycosyl hydrolase [Ardenticatenaceae bacterium]